jgi:hypothetical protein
MIIAKYISLRARGLLLPLLMASVLPAGQALATTFTYNNFSDVSGLSLNGDAAKSGSVLRVDSSAVGTVGSAYQTAPVPLDGNTAFSTSFEFLVSTNPGDPTDGFTFLLQKVGPSALGDGGDGLGYVGITPSTAVIFRGRGPSFIGVINGGVNPSALPTPFEPPLGFTSLPEGVFYNQNEYAWIDYNPTTTSLSVYLSTTGVKPASAIMTATVDVFGNLGSQAYVGFSAGNGAAFGNQDILNWTFTSTEVPEPSTAGVVGMGLATLGLVRRRGKR